MGYCTNRSLLFLSLLAVGCAGPVAGPDKQFQGGLQGMAAGAGTGAIAGLHLSAGTGPGAAVGAGLGAVAGGIQGAINDGEEEQMIAASRSLQQERARAVAHEVLNDQLKRRMALHPTREIYPADLFFYGDETSIKRASIPLLEELARLNKLRLPHSRLIVAVYSQARGSSGYAEHLTERRSKAIADGLIRFGLDPRRVQTRPVVVDQPVLVDPNDDPMRFAQAVELILMDR